MGCDIHTFVEVQKDGQWSRSDAEIFNLDDVSAKYHQKTHTDSPFDWRSYGMFGFLANVRNYSEIPPLSDPRGVPENCTAAKEDVDDWDYHSWTWFDLKELIDFDYERTFEDTRGCGAGELGETISFRKFLGPAFFEDIEAMKALGKPDQVRVVICFDN